MSKVSVQTLIWVHGSKIRIAGDHTLPSNQWMLVGHLEGNG